VDVPGGPPIRSAQGKRKVRETNQEKDPCEGRGGVSWDKEGGWGEETEVAFNSGDETFRSI